MIHLIDVYVSVWKDAFPIRCDYTCNVVGVSVSENNGLDALWCDAGGSHVCYKPSRIGKLRELRNVEGTRIDQYASGWHVDNSDVLLEDEWGTGAKRSIIISFQSGVRNDERVDIEQSRAIRDNDSLDATKGEAMEGRVVGAGRGGGSYGQDC